MTSRLGAGTVLRRMRANVPWVLHLIPPRSGGTADAIADGEVSLSDTRRVRRISRSISKPTAIEANRYVPPIMRATSSSVIGRSSRQSAIRAVPTNVPVSASMQVRVSGADVSSLPETTTSKSR